ncbi:DUF4129 domain-containing protein [Tenggerimyces flavus]|uniref:DUF4129 domain-containing protein n=1 Tax=Tenggerimyces flavus TaxID=1708749 RepID=A0ABV7YE21_9ACTN|nr:DUF4129 domain-containing protein [Tenggerimyces flavus]MBM7784299.1 hypothetical protein [Tenggerimyces flavus]
MVRRAGMIAGVVALLAAIIVVAALTSGQVTRLPLPKGSFLPPSPPPAPTFGPSGPGLGGRGQGGSTLGTILLVAVIVLAAVIAALVIWFLVRLLRRLLQAQRGRIVVRHTPVTVKAAPAREVQPDEVDSAIQEGIDELDSDEGDPRRAVIACWVRLERLAAKAGAARAPGDTPAELVAHMLVAVDVSGAVLERLAALYRRARYAPAEVSEDMRAEALATLRQVRSELAGVS